LFSKEKRIVRKSLFVAISGLFLLCAASFGQTVSGDLTGFVYDASGAVIANANVVVRNQATGVETSTKTSGAGEYRIGNLLVGAYTATVSASGFKTAQTKDIRVSLNQVTTANFTLQVGGTSTSVEVTESAAVIDTTTAQIQNGFSSTQMAELPSASTGAGILNLSLLNPGVASSGSVGAGTGPSVGGQRPRNNNFTIEGIDNNDGAVTGPVVTVPNDGVAEFTVLQNQFSPEFGHSSGGQFNTVVKSGGNAYHGGAYEYFENRNLNAADNLSAIDGTSLHPRYDNNRFGGYFGGPIRQNKLFFFALYEYNPVGNSASAGLVYAPTQQGYSLLSSIPGVSQTNLGILRQYLGSAATPFPTSSLYPSVGGVSIPIGQLPISAPAYTNNERSVVSVDDTMSEIDNLRFRFILNRSGSIDTSASLPAFYTTVPVNGYVATLSEYHAFSPTVTNEFRLGYNRYSQNYPVGNQTFPGLDAFPNITIYELNGVNIGPDPNAPQFGYQNTYQLTDNVTVLKGNHTLKFGLDGWKNISPQSFTQRSRGDYEWNTLEGYLLDQYPDYYAQRSLGNVVYYGDRFLLGGFANDSWKIRPNLTVNLGLRYEFETIPYSENLQDLNAGSSVPGLITFRSPKPDTNDFMPRVGIAYSPGKEGKTSIRAGFGINYDVLYDNQGILSLPPQLTTTVDVTGQNGTGFLANGGIPPNASGVPLTAAQLRAGTGGYIPDQVRPKALQWNIGIQRVFHNDYTFESRYLGTRGINLPMQIQLNRQPVVTAQNALPVYFSAPSQATLNSLTNTLSSLNAAYTAGGDVIPAYYNAGFTGIITAYEPWGNSSYNGWANSLTRRFSNGLQFVASYTLSHNIDDSTADVFSTYTTPRRPQDSQNLRPERASSALDHRNRLTAELLYDFQPFKNRSWVLKNLVGNWELAPVYTYQTGTLVTVQSGLDSNMNGDSAGDRVIVNPNGTVATGSGTTPLTNSAGDVVGYLVNNPNAEYIVAPKGTLANGGRNTEHLHPINDVDMTFAKAININERFKMQFAGRFTNIFNHPQYTGGYLNDVQPLGQTSGPAHNFLIPNQSTFLDPTMAFSSNPRSIQLSLKLTF
jgi:hypothetical protein